jgi:hypothetical protein
MSEETNLVQVASDESQSGLSNVKNLADMVLKLRKEVLIEGVDYGIIPGTGNKPTLLLPGIEKLMTMLNAVPIYELMACERNHETGLCYYEFSCRLVDIHGQPIPGGVGMGSCSSQESAFRWRWVSEANLPYGIDKNQLKRRGSTITEFKFAIDKSETSGKYGKPVEYWQKFRDAMTDGTAVYGERMAGGKNSPTVSIPDYLYRVPNEDIFDQWNTILKLAKKRALIDAGKSGANLSEFFTADLEDNALPEDISISQPIFSNAKREAKPESSEQHTFKALRVMQKEDKKGLSYLAFSDGILSINCFDVDKLPTDVYKLNLPIGEAVTLPFDLFITYTEDPEDPKYLNFLRASLVH